jgi:hypothetical protein
MVVLKLRLQNRRWGGVYETPVFNSAAGGFVYVYGGTHLKKQRSAILAVFPMDAFGPEWRMVDRQQKMKVPLYL